MKKISFIRLFSLFCILTLLPGALPAQAVQEKGKVKDGIFTNADGVSFTVPYGFSLSDQENLNTGVYRIYLDGQRDSYGYCPLIVLEISPGGRDVTKYNAMDFASDISSSNVTWKYDKFSDFCVLEDHLVQKNGRTQRNMFVVSRIQRWSVLYNCFARCYCFSTVKSFVRLYYICFSAQQTMIRDLESLDALYDTLIVP